ncbi:alpha-N-acetylglucosaminidase [Alteromonas confluentis]|uniref:alpha-N-acetylglucosaminidase n=1 Tax=Alteromonas confluentis TaxID=1656094 RepID=UPI000AC4DB96|nr:alpha-N-acetylglucosaminidase [Alteromonas confluentis]
MSKAKIGSVSALYFAVMMALSGCDKTAEAPKASSENQNAATATAIAEHSAVEAVLARVTNSKLTNLSTRKVSDEKPEWYEVDVRDGKAEISGNSDAAMAYGAYQFLREQGALSVSWEGNRVDLPASFADFDGEPVATPFNQRAYLNVCAYGYTTPWWNWDRWEQEIDWMALHGVNNPVAMEGQEYVWQALWREFNVSDDELSSYFSGPAFTPWQRMGNIEGHAGPLPQSWIDKKHDLQKKILARMDELGMKPVVPAFSGYVPKAFVELFPDAKIYEMPPWSGFERETYWLDPADPLFNKVAKRFIEIYSETYGEQEYYLSDAFNEMLPPVSEETRYEDLASYGKRIYQSIEQASPEATWVMQGWMFGADEEFWDLPSIEAFLRDVPDAKSMIHDIGNDRYHVWQRTEGFKGKPWIFGFIHNYGGSDPVYADFGDYVEQLDVVTHSENKGALSGFGVFPEGINNNSVAYEFLFDLPWEAQPDMQSWVAEYTNARYGKTSPELLAAWDKLIDGVYSVRYWTTRWWEGSAGAYVLFKRPDYKLTAFSGNPGDLASLDAGIEQLLAVADEYKDAPLFVYDLVDMTKQSVSLHADLKLQAAIQAYQNKEFEKGDALVTEITDLVTRLDALMGWHQETLHSWLSDASAYGESAEESAFFITNARQQITQWGGSSLKDYASKAWQGMYADFYLPRWTQYLTAYRDAMQQGKTFDDEAQQQALIKWEREWIEQSDIPALDKPENPVSLVSELMATIKADGNR